MSETPTRPPASGPEPPPEPQPPAKGPLDDLDPKLAGLLAYVFGWVSGLILFFTHKHPEVRFHAAQSILTFGGLSVLYALLGAFSSAMPFGLGLWALFGLLSTLLGLAALGLWILLCIKGYNLEHFKLPIIGDYAERWVEKA
jgi:uncharacterized membrane protein